MGILEYLWQSLGPEARKELAKDAARNVVKTAGNTVYQKADEIRQRFEEARQAEQAKKRAQAEAREKKAGQVREAKAIDDELAELKRRVADAKKK